MRANGKKRRIWATTSIQHDKYGKATHVPEIVQDITDREF
jgi:hypothetical protein